MGTPRTSDRYTIFPPRPCRWKPRSYREYLDPKYRDDFDAWRGRYKNPFKDLRDNRRIRNWDDERRNSEQKGDGVAGEVTFPTPCRLFLSFVLFAEPPTTRSTCTATPGSRPTTGGWRTRCDEFPERRAGVGQIFLNDVDDAIADVKRIKENGLRGGVLRPNVPPTPVGEAAVRPGYDPLWEVLPDLEVPRHVHTGTGDPDYGPYPPRCRSTSTRSPSIPSARSCT